MSKTWHDFANDFHIRSLLKAVFSKNILKNPIVTGSLMLSAAGIITKIIGFFYRIFTSRIFDEEGLGIIGLTTPVMVIVHSVCVTGIQTAITRFVAASGSDKGKPNSRYAYLFTGMVISLSLTALCSYFIFIYAGFISEFLLGDIRCRVLVRITALSFPLASVHSCINGFFYGNKKTLVPSLSTIIEQLVRVATVLLLYRAVLSLGANASLSFVCIGLLMGEFASAAFSCIALFVTSSKDRTYVISADTSNEIQSNQNTCKRHKKSFISLCLGGRLLRLAAPISLNRLCISLLSSLETIMIPRKLTEYGLSLSGALSVYGIFSGMALPLIHFPSAFTASVSSLLLPSVSEAQSRGRTAQIKKTICITILFCLSLGIVFMVFFYTCSGLIGKYLFDNTEVCSQIRALSLMCPFFYMSGALGSILNGLGRTGTTFLFNTLSALVRLAFLFFIVPAAGFGGYIYGVLCAQILLDILFILALRRYLLYN